MGEQPALVVLVGEGLHHAHPADVLLDAGVELPDATEQLAEIARHAGAIAASEQAGGGHDQGGEQRQLRVDREHERKGADEGHHRDEQVFRAVMGDFADFLQVLGHAGDEVAGLLVVVESEREFLQMIEGAAAHLGFNVDAEHVAPIGDHDHQATVDQVDRQQAYRGDHDQAPILPRQQPVHEGADGHGKAEFEQARNDRATEIQQEQAPIGTIVREEAPQHRAGWHADVLHGLNLGRRCRRAPTLSCGP